MEQNHNPAKGQIDDNSIKVLEWNEHIQRRPEMYIGQLAMAPTLRTESTPC